MFSLELFYRFILSRRAGSLIRSISRISIIGIWLGVAALILVMSVMNGFNRSIQDRLIGVEPHLLVSFGAKSSKETILSSDIYKELKAEPGSQVEVFSQQALVIRTEEGKIEMANLKGVSRTYLRTLFENLDRRKGYDMSQGKKKLDSLAPGEIFMGLQLAEAMGVYQDNSLVLIPPENLLLPPGEVPIYTVADVKDFVMAEHEPIDRQTLFFIDGESFPRLQNTAGIERGIEVKFQDPTAADLWKAELVQRGVDVQTWKDRNASLFFALKVEKVVVALLVGLSTLIAGLSIISVMVLLLIQKKKDIGNFLAMGMPRLTVRSLFVQIGMVLSSVGIVAGTVTGLLLCLLVDNFSEDVLPQFYEETNIPAEIHSFQVLFIFLVAYVFSFCTLVWAMRNLSKVSPSEALRG